MKTTINHMTVKNLAAYISLPNENGLSGRMQYWCAIFKTIISQY